VIVCSFHFSSCKTREREKGILRTEFSRRLCRFKKWWSVLQVTRLIPNAHGTTCNQRVEKIIGTKHSFILRVPFHHEGSVLRNWVSRFDIYPFLEQFVVVSQNYPWQDQTNSISTALLQFFTFLVSQSVSDK
jgi:hypothetical protein